MPVIYMDPRGEVAAHSEPYELAVDLTVGAPTVALLANGFPDSGEFMESVGVALSEALPGARVLHFAKASATAPASEALIKEIVASGCAAAVTAYGH